MKKKYIIGSAILGTAFIFAVYKSETTRLRSVQQSMFTDTIHSELKKQSKTTPEGKTRNVKPSKKPVDNSSRIDSPKTDYSLLEIGKNDKFRFAIYLRISQMVSDNELISMARDVKDDINTISGQGTMFFLLPEIVLDHGAWAAVEFTPEMKVRMIGQSIKDEQKIRSALESITDYVGLWSDRSEQGDIIIRIRKDNNKGYVFEYISSTDTSPSNLVSKLIKRTKDGKTLFEDTESPDYFLLEDNGDLSAYDEHGYIITYKKLK
jgi:hypothetical protein